MTGEGDLTLHVMNGKADAWGRLAAFFRTTYGLPDDTENACLDLIRAGAQQPDFMAVLIVGGPDLDTDPIYGCITGYVAAHQQDWLHPYLTDSTLDRTLLDHAFVIAELAVAPDHQRRGLGFTLVEIAVSWARDLGFDHLLAQVDDDNHACLTLLNYWEMRPISHPVTIGQSTCRLYARTL